MLNEMGFSKCFDKVFASAHLGHKKPAMEFYEKVLEDLEIKDKQSVLFWDDSKENVEGAREFGIKGEIYNNFEDFKERMRVYLSKI
jgi:putative hydrolase of the HAD superfamily